MVNNLARQQERRVHRERQMDTHIRETKEFFKQTHSIHRSLALARSRQEAQREASEETEKCAIEEEERRKIKEIHRFQDEAAAAIVEQQRMDSERQQRQRTALLQSNNEIRELQQKIQAVKIDCIRDQQLQAFKSTLKDAEDLEAETVTKETIRAAQEEEKILQEKQSKRQIDLKTRIDLLSQIDQKADIKKKAREEAAQERAVLNKLVLCAAQNEEQRLKEAQHKRRAFMQEVHMHNELTKELKEKQRALEIEEMRKMQAYVQFLRQREERIDKERAKRQHALDTRLKELCHKAEETKARSEEEELLLEMLYCELERQRAQRALAEETAHRQRQQQELQEAHLSALKLKAERQDSEKVQEEHFRHRLMEQLAEQDKIDAMNTLARRRAIAQHIKEADYCISYRRRLAQALKDEEAQLQMMIQKKKAEEDMIVEDERKRLLCESADILQRHVPRGLLKTAEDLHIVVASSK